MRSFDPSQGLGLQASVHSHRELDGVGENNPGQDEEYDENPEGDEGQLHLLSRASEEARKLDDVERSACREGYHQHVPEGRGIHVDRADWADAVPSPPIVPSRRRVTQRPSASAKQSSARPKRPGRRRQEAPARQAARHQGQHLGDDRRPEEVIDHTPEVCSGCGAGLGEADVTGTTRRQVFELPAPAPVVPEHRAQTRRVRLLWEGDHGVFPRRRAGPSVLRASGAGHCRLPAGPPARPHPTGGRGHGRAVRDRAGHRHRRRRLRRGRPRLGGFIAALVAWLRTLPVLHADETTDRIGTAPCWMHVVSTRLYTLVQASVTRGTDAIVEAGMLMGYRG